VVRERHQRPRVKDLGTKWKIFYWDYSSGKRCAHTKSWTKSKFPTWAEAQREADQFIEGINERNNQPQPFPFGEGTLAALVEMCREKIWPLLKNSTRISYDFYLDTHILPKWGSVKLAKMRTIELQDFFNSFSPRLAPKDDSQYARMSQSGFEPRQDLGNHSREPCSGSSTSPQEGKEASCTACQAGYSPCDRFAD